MVAHMPPDISYGLECATECFDITSDVITYFHLFNQVPLAPLMDNFPYHSSKPGENIRGYARLYNRVYSNWFWKQATHWEQAWCLSKAVDSFGRKSAELIDCLWSGFISDCLTKDRDPALRKHQQNWLDNSRNINHAAKIVAQLARKIHHVGVDDVLYAICQPVDCHDRLCLPEPEPFIITHGERLTTSTPAVRAINKTIQRDKRSVLKRSSAFLSRVIGQKNTSLFIGGKEIRITGERFVFSIHKKSILSQNWQALSIAVHDKDTDTRLFNLCWYIDKTPAMDQLSALALAVKCGDEDSIIEIGNILAMDKAAVEQNDYTIKLLEKRFKKDTDETFNLNSAVGPGPDTLMHQYPGTQEYFLAHPTEYIQFHQRCVKRIMKQHFNPTLGDRFRIHDPWTLRPFVNGRVLPQLVDEQHSALQVSLFPIPQLAA